MFTDMLQRTNIERYNRYTTSGLFFAEKFNHTIKDLLERVVFEKGNSNWLDFFSTIKKQYKFKIYSPTKLNPMQASLKKSGGYVYKNLLDKC